MPRNLIICCDGTSNQFGLENTNVVRLVQVLERDPSRQHVYYDPGVGTLPEPGVWTWLGQKISELWGLAFGAGLAWKVGEAYSFLMDYWEPGDQVFMFGFSRGAYAVRVLAGLLHLMGLMPHGNHNLVPYVLRLFAAGKREEPKYWNICNNFRWTFARRVREGDDQRNFRVHFLGLWDTVSSVGWVWEPFRYPYTAENPSVDIVRHAVSLDERRWFFRQNLMTKPKEVSQDLEERWFPGVHCDVGGGYPERCGRLWWTPFEWILSEARTAGLLVNEERLKRIENTPPEKPWMEPQHESLKWYWWPAEFFPKMVWRSKLSCQVPSVGLGRHRTVHDGALIDKSTLMRIRKEETPEYSPPNLSQAFLKMVRGLSEVPDALPYEK
jgi:uncharacterized protein (DUF2235 family)